MNETNVISPPADPGNFSSEFAKAHGHNWSRWLGHLIGNPEAVGLELGTWRGESAEWALDNVFTHQNARYHCVDWFKGSEEHQIAGIDCSDLEQIARNRLARFGIRCEIHRAMSADFLAEFLHEGGKSFDFIYIDAAHDAMNVLRDSVLAFDLLKPGGVIIWDDIEWTVMQDEIDRPKLAVDGFLACYARRLEVIGVGWQIACRKVA